MAKIILNVFSFFFIAFVAFIAAPRPVAAYDDRLVLKWTTAQFATGVDFCNEWDAAWYVVFDVTFCSDTVCLTKYRTPQQRLPPQR